MSLFQPATTAFGPNSRVHNAPWSVVSAVYDVREKEAGAAVVVDDVTKKRKVAVMNSIQEVGRASLFNI